MENQGYSRKDVAAFKKDIEEKQKRMDETLARQEQGDGRYKVFFFFFFSFFCCKVQ